MTTIRRVLALVAFAFWQGGFTFYTAVVVPTGTEVLGSAVAQGFITRQVTRWINVAGPAALVFLTWDAIATRSVRRTRLLMCLLLAAGVVTLMILHPQLDRMLDAERERVLDRSAFRPVHRMYLWVSTAQWCAGVGYLALTPFAWRRDDRGLT